MLKIMKKAYTCTDTTETITLGEVKSAQIKKIQILASASTDFHIYCDNSGDYAQLNDEDILGTSGSKITVNTTLTIYPVVPQYLTTNAITDPDQYIPLIVSGTIKATTANAAAADTFTIMIWYDEEEAC